MSKARCRVGVCIWLVAAGGMLAAGGTNDSQPPNIVLLVADDLGWGDVGYHGSEIRTPHIDGLARSGVRLDRFYVYPRCTPSRAALLTGRYPFRYGLHKFILRVNAPGGLPTTERTLAETLRAAGYFTAIVGKWHLGHNEPVFRPLQRGFDHHYGSYSGAIHPFTKKALAGGQSDWFRNEVPVADERYATDLLAEEAVQLIRENAGKRPFFLYVPFTAPHTPYIAPEEYIARYAAIADEERRTYAAMVTCMDDAIGRIVAALRQAAVLERTLIVFISDNGAADYHAGRNAPLRGGKKGPYEGGIRVPAVIRWDGKIKPGASVSELIHIVDLYPTLARLAGASTDQPLPLDGRDAWDTIANGKRSSRSEFPISVADKVRALRLDQWKLVITAAQKGSQSQAQVELFDIASDPRETRNVAEAHADLVARMRARMAAYDAEAVDPLDMRPKSEKRRRRHARELKEKIKADHARGAAAKPDDPDDD